MIRSLLIILFISFEIISSAQLPAYQQLGLTPPSVNHCTSVKDQFLSGTCWSFSSLSLLESELLKTGKGKVDLSEMFVARHSMVRKIQRHLKLKGGNFFTPGGQFHDVMWVMKNFGMMPEEAYNGKPQGAFNHDHGELDTVLSRFVKLCVRNGITELNQRQQAFVDSVLDVYLGKIPAEFTFKGRVYTAFSFRDQYMDINPDDYLEITSYTHHPFYTKFVLEDKYNWTADQYWNVPLEDFSRITDEALQNGYTVGWDGDANDPDFDFSSGLAYFKSSNQSTQMQRQVAFTSEATLLDHMMHIVGSTTDKYGHKWYYIKNSWGNYSNPLGGFMFMREDYFRIRTVAVIVNKQVVPADIRKKMRL
ncbi:MAG TPA: C1 family peptidase [Chitinophagaceae bacterium]|nr:C1 family peptidase [Chitinophagaceae bacterium]